MNQRKFLVTILWMFVLITLLPASNAFARTAKEVTLSENSTSVELQALLDLNKEGEYDLTIHIPKGNYELNNELRIYSYTTIVADDEARMLKKHLKGSILTNDLSNDNGYLSATDITIKGGIWDSLYIVPYNKGTESFRFIHASNITIQDATVCRVPNNSHLITFAGVKNGTIKNCKLYGYYGEDLKEAIQLDIVHDKVMVPSNQSALIRYDDLPCFNILIEGNSIYSFPRAIGSHMSVKGIFHQNITIKNNKIFKIDEVAIKLYNYANTNITDNEISNCGGGILVYTYMPGNNHYLPSVDKSLIPVLFTDYRVNIKYNRISNIKQYISTSGSAYYGDAIRTIGSSQRPLNGVTIMSNTCEDIARYGIYMDYSPDGYVGGNTVRNTTRYGILLANSNDSKIRYNKLSKTGAKKSNYGGIGIDASDNLLLYKNTVYTNAKNGIYLNVAAHNNVVKENIISGISKPLAIVSANGSIALLSNKIK